MSIALRATSRKETPVFEDVVETRRIQSTPETDPNYDDHQVNNSPDDIPAPRQPRWLEWTEEHKFAKEIR